MNRFLFLACLIPVVCFYFLHQTTIVSSNFDGYVYTLLAQSLLEDGTYTLWGIPHCFFPPGYPIIISFFAPFFEDNIFAVQFVNMMLWIFNILILAKLGLRFTGSKSISILAVALYLSSYRIQVYSLELYAENVLTTLYLLSVYLILDIAQSQLKFRKYMALVLLCLLSYYCKPEAILLFIACMVYLFYKFKKKFVQFFFYGSLVYLIGISPWMIWTHSITGSYSISGKSNAIIDWANKEHQGISIEYVFNFPHLDHTDTLGDLFHHLSTMDDQTFKPTLGGFLKNAFQKPVEYTFKYMGMILPFFLIGFLLKRTHWKDALVQFPMLVICLSFLCMTVLYPSTRFWIPFMPFFYLYASRGLFLFYEWIKKHYPAKPKCLYGATLTVAILLQFPFGWIVHPEYKPNPVFHEKWGNYTDFNSAQHMASNHASLIYVFRDYNPVMIPITSSANELHRFCQAHHVDYLFLYGWNPALSSPIFPPGLISNEGFVEKSRIPLDRDDYKFILVLQCI